ncbi:MAG: hypothetical protein NTW00_17330, partial [Hyphomicrobiales bacterium]|nr:hypothetical protein [Hyphomicrobiales bacterium]
SSRSIVATSMTSIRSTVASVSAEMLAVDLMQQCPESSSQQLGNAGWRQVAKRDVVDHERVRLIFDSPLAAIRSPGLG